MNETDHHRTNLKKKNKWTFRKRSIQDIWTYNYAMYNFTSSLCQCNVCLANIELRLMTYSSSENRVKIYPSSQAIHCPSIEISIASMRPLSPRMIYPETNLLDLGWIWVLDCAVLIVVWLQLPEVLNTDSKQQNVFDLKTFMIKNNL